MTSPLFGQMMDVPLTRFIVVAHAARHFGDTEIVSRRIEGDFIATPGAIAKSARNNLRRR